MIGSNMSTMDESTLNEIIITYSIKTNNFIRVHRWVMALVIQIMDTQNIEILTFIIKNTFTMLGPYMEIITMTNILFTDKP